MTKSAITLYDDASERWRLIEADALLALAKLPAASLDAIVTDPPYGIEFHGEAWDGAEIRRRTDVGGNEAFEGWTSVWAREVARLLKPGGHLLAFGAPRTFHRLVCGVEDAGLEVRDQVLWLFGQGIPKSRRMPGGLGTQLKPAYEPILIARAPLRGTVSANVSRFGTGALNIEEARHRTGDVAYWPANVALTHSADCPARLIESEQTGRSRLFYCAKATRHEREAGCGQLPTKATQIYAGKHHPVKLVANHHPTVKPVALMRWLVRLAVPEGGTVLDPFCGSGTTGIAAVLEGRRFLGIERESDYVDVACARLTHWAKQGGGGG